MKKILLALLVISMTVLTGCTKEISYSSDPESAQEISSVKAAYNAPGLK